MESLPFWMTAWEKRNDMPLPPGRARGRLTAEQAAAWRPPGPSLALGGARAALVHRSMAISAGDAQEATQGRPGGGGGWGEGSSHKIKCVLVAAYLLQRNGRPVSSGEPSAARPGQAVRARRCSALCGENSAPCRQSSGEFYRFRKPPILKGESHKETALPFSSRAHQCKPFFFAKANSASPQVMSHVWKWSRKFLEVEQEVSGRDMPAGV